MDKNPDELFQERVDELLLIEQRADRRAGKFIELVNAYQEKSQGMLDDLLCRANDVNETLIKINRASDSVDEYVTLCAKHVTHTTKLFLGTVVLVILIVTGTLWWSHYIDSSLADAKSELANLNTKLKHTPVFLHFYGKEYVRVIPKSETSFSKGDEEVPGRYSRIWHVR